jgi:hypothetical protein
VLQIIPPQYFHKKSRPENNRDGFFYENTEGVQRPYSLAIPLIFRPKPICSIRSINELASLISKRE